ncbi:MAG: hypothetical protein J1F16_01415 [Muribaculaceae bacterium]|nr:hypothetical protein [Muribaculaceae bacterium]
MKKLFYLFAAAALILGSCSDKEPENNPGGESGGGGSDTPEVTGPTLAFGYCGDLYTAIGSRYAGTVLEAAIQIPMAQAQQWIGNKVTGIRIGFGQGSTDNIMVFVTKTLTGTPIVIEPAKITTMMGWNEITFKTPYEIDGSPFYIGYQYQQMNVTEYPIGFDYVVTDSPYADNLGFDNEWDHLGSLFGSVCIQAMVSGENLPENDVIVNTLYLPDFALTNESFNSLIQVGNTGTKTVNSLTVTGSVGGVEVVNQTVTLETPLKTGEFDYVEVDGLTCNTDGVNIPVTLAVTQVNGVQPASAVNKSVTGSVNCADTSYDRNVVFEEFTGTWCIWCPRGIVGMQYMEENYGDDGFIGVAGHMSQDGGTADPMESPTYAEVVDFFSQSSFPSAIVDRKYYFDPGPDTMEEYFQIQKETPSVAGVEISATYNASDETVSVTGTSEFALNLSDVNYGWVFILCENKVGPYNQSNGYAGGSEGEMGGWEKLPSRVAWIYNEVARDVVGPFGATGSIPANITKATKYSYDATLDAGDVVDINNCYVVGMIVAPTGEWEVINGAKVSVSDNSVATQGMKPYAKTRSSKKTAGKIDKRSSYKNQLEPEKAGQDSRFHSLKK